MTEIAFFHVDLPGIANPYHQSGVTYADMMSMMVKSARDTYPGCTITMLTDQHTPEPDGIDAIYRRNVKLDELMVENVRAQAAHIEMSNHDNILYCDTDILHRRQVDSFGLLDRKTSGIGLTYRLNMPMMPFNYGVIFARRSVQAHRFFSMVLKEVSHMSPDHKKWFGNQLAVARLIDHGMLKKYLSDKSMDGFSLPGDTHVMAFPCEQYNYTPEKLSDVKDQYILHFKGNRKEMMKKIYEQEETRDLPRVHRI